MNFMSLNKEYVNSVTFSEYTYIPLTFYVHGSMHHESNLIILQQDASYLVYYVSVGSSACFEC